MACQKAGTPIPLDCFCEGIQEVQAFPGPGTAEIVGDEEPATATMAPPSGQLKSLAFMLPWLLNQHPDLGWCLHLPFSRLSAALIAWILAAVGLVSTVSTRTVQRWLKAEKIKPWNFRSWISPKNLKVFLERARVVLALYARVSMFDSDEAAFSVDEKTSIQARERATHEPPKKGKPGRLQQSYVRKGAVQLYAALNVAMGNIFHRLHKGKGTFLIFSDFLTSLIKSAVAQGYRKIHIILDNGSAHRPKALQAWVDAWLIAQNLTDVTVHIHLLPVRSSWLNQVEIFFGRLQDYVLTVNDYESIEALKSRISTFIEFWNLRPRPIEWTYTTADLEHQFARNPDTPDPRLSRPKKKRYKKAA